MKVSREQYEANQQRILEAAGRLFREHGYDAVTLAEVMQAASLTHGGFYGHFKSKDDLIAQALAYRNSKPKAEIGPAEFAESYLSARHRADLAGGCNIAGLATETTRQPLPARAAMTETIRSRIEGLARNSAGANPAEKRRVAIASWSAMVGAMIMARVCDDPALSDEIMHETRAQIAALAELQGGN
ncbi:TetR/AcrR family transcriptional regulator [Undibacterium terreum]|uniref:TetR family transcriptional regulator n=1 Tax=Undibacterium terreum TaxID=1224302 RepID=A0A916XPK0_9BURK|nr:TetR family transcriptional regulator [Undibacterium terreum]GGC88811.1 TetR family transcriptional regulator [Undibacterium terreum]